ncbi:MAG: CHASE2 domain-containing protein [Caulobacter sp.]|nr:CHASE2 domain-containing protein [Caulobacter sp.]
MSITVRRLLVAICLPLALAAVAFSGLFAFRDQLKVGDAATLLVDQKQKFQADTVAPKLGARPLVFIDYDHATMRALGHPATIPHSSMAILLKQAGRMRPWAVILDVDPSWSACAQACGGLVAAIGDLADSGTLVLIQRGLLQSAKGELPRLRPTSLDAAFEQKPRVLWVSNRLIPSGDGIVRREQPWSVACLGNEAHALPAPSVALWSAQQGQLTELLAFLRVEAAKGAAACASPGNAAPYRPDRQLPGTNSDYRAVGQIRYTLSWEPKSVDMISGPSTEGPQLRVVQAWRLLDGQASLGPQVARGAVVIIGSSAPDRLDIVTTPLGDMPGAIELANSVRAKLEFGPGRQTPFWSGLFLVIGMTSLSIAATFAAVTYLPPRWRKFGDLFVPIGIAMASWLVLMLVDASSAALPLVLQQFIVSLIVRVVLSEPSPSVASGRTTA